MTTYLDFLGKKLYLATAVRAHTDSHWDPYIHILILAKDRVAAKRIVKKDVRGYKRNFEVLLKEVSEEDYMTDLDVDKKRILLRSYYVYLD